MNVEEEEGGLWVKCLKSQGVESGVGLQFVHGRTLLEWLYAVL